MTPIRRSAEDALNAIIAAVGAVPANCIDDVERMLKGSDGNLMALAMILDACRRRSTYRGLRWRMNRVLGLAPKARASALADAK